MLNKAVNIGLSALFLLSNVSLAGNASADRVADLKSKIVAISAANTTRVDNLAAARAELQPLVDELIDATPARSEAEKLTQVVGAWKNLWTDMYFGPTVDLTQTYQVVNPSGFYYNISRNVIGPTIFTDYLRGSFVDQCDHLGIIFTRDFTVNGWLASDTDLVSVATDAESGRINGADVPNSRAVGVSGSLQNTYVDEDLRIVTGQSDGQSQVNMFVLTRVTSN